MRRLPWWLAAAIAFVLGAAAGGLARHGGGAASDGARLPTEVAALQARLRAAEARLAERGDATSAPAVSPVALTTDLHGRTADRSRAGAHPERSARASLVERGALALPGSADLQRPAPATPPGPAVLPTVDGALERFYAYLDERNGSGGPGRWQRMRQLVDDLRAMGDAGAEALMRVLAGGSTSEERQTAARLLGELKPPAAVPALQDVLDKSGDVLLRRAAAGALGRLQSPDSIPVLDSLVANPNEDRFVRMSAARGLARLDRAEGVAGLVQIFDEANLDGRGRDMAFRSLRSLDDDRALPFMRRLVSSDAEVSYRVDAIRFLTAHGDRQSLPLLQQVMQSATEQPSVRDAAAQAHAAIAAR